MKRLIACHKAFWDTRMDWKYRLVSTWHSLIQPSAALKNFEVKLINKE